MNAGAYGSEMKDIVLKTTYIDMEGNINTIYNNCKELFIDIVRQKLQFTAKRTIP